VIYIPRLVPQYSECIACMSLIGFVRCVSLKDLTERSNVDKEFACNVHRVEHRIVVHVKDLYYNRFTGSEHNLSTPSNATFAPSSSTSGDKFWVLSVISFLYFCCC
jgi:hypothetical protein